MGRVIPPGRRIFQRGSVASPYIKDPETAALVTRVAKRSGITNTALVRGLAAAREAELQRNDPPVSSWKRLQQFWRDHPLGEPTGLVADKAFFGEHLQAPDPEIGRQEQKRVIDQLSRSIGAQGE